MPASSSRRSGSSDAASSCVCAPELLCFWQAIRQDLTVQHLSLSDGPRARFALAVYECVAPSPQMNETLSFIDNSFALAVYECVAPPR